MVQMVKAGVIALLVALLLLLFAGALLVEMERTLGKQRILALYLNTVDWGPGICGAVDAARVYFAATSKRLNPVQAAWLGGILRNPHRAYRQEFLTRTPEARRLNWVLA